jgi:carboxymethylenebutenolidase
MGDIVEFPSNGHGASGYLAVPGSGGGPGVVVIQEWWGLVPHITDVCDRFAAAGFVALAPDLYHGETTTEPDEAGKLMMALNLEQAAKDMAGAITRVQTDPQTRGDDVGVIGFCMGGGFALMAAVDRGFDAASSNYGYLPNDEDALLRACPVVGSYGARDGSLKGAAAKLEAVLERGGIPHDVKEYPDAGHAFLNDAQSGPLVARLLTRRVLGAGPEPASAADAWKRIDAFFGEHLK